MLIDKPIQQFGSVDSVKTTEFQIDITPKLFEMLSGLYPNKIRAVIRELLCNAIDSHIVAGISDVPVDIFIPSAEYPYLTIKDYGVGMSPDDVIQIYTRYSKSTKTHEASTTGALGLGSKSPFCYTNMFTLKSVHDGVESLYNVYINQQRIPSLTLLSQKPTDDENGVTVTVPVKAGDYRDFATNLIFVLHHTKSPVRVYDTVRLDDADVVDGEYVGDGSDGTELEDVTAKFDQFDGIVEHTENKRFHFISRDPWGNSSTKVYILQANVIYPIQDPDLVAPLFTAALKPRSGALVFEVDNGSISFSPTREELSMDVETIDKITSMVNELTKKAQSWSKFYAVYMSRYRKKGQVVDDSDLPLVLRKPFWKYLYNYKAIKTTQNNNWSSQRVTAKNGKSYRKTLDGYRPYSPTYHVNLNEASTTSKIGYIITTRYQPEDGKGKLLLDDLINNMYKWFNVKPELDTYGTMNLIVHGKDIREVWSKVKMLGTSVKLVEIDESRFQEIYKAPPKPRSPTRLFVLDTTTRYTTIEDEKISDFGGYDRYVIRYNRNVCKGDKTITISDMCDLVTKLRRLDDNTTNTGYLNGKRVLVVTQAQYKKIQKENPQLKLLWDDLDISRLSRIMNHSALISIYDSVSNRDVYQNKQSLIEIFKPFMDDESLRRNITRVVLEYNRTRRLMDYNHKHAKLPNPTLKKHAEFSSWDMRSCVSNITSTLTRLGIGVNVSEFKAGITFKSGELVRVEYGDGTDCPFDVFIKYVRHNYFHNMYNLEDPDVIRLYNDYIRDLFRRNNIMSVDEMRTAYNHTINLLDKLTTRR